MKKLSRGAIAAIAALAAVPASYAAVKTAEHAGWHRMSPETRARLDEGKLAMVKAALKLSPDQEKLWAPLETQVRDTVKSREGKRAEMEAMRAQREKDRAEGKKPDLAERFDKMSQNMSERADRMKAFAGAFKPFYASLNQDQKDVLQPLLRQISPAFGGHRHGGHRFAEGFGGPQGWGGGWGHHGGRHHGHRGGPGMEGPDAPGGGGGGPGKPGNAPTAPQNSPDLDGNEDGMTPPDQKL